MYIINVFIFLFIYFYTGPILIAVFITEMVILFKHVIIIIRYVQIWSRIVHLLCLVKAGFGVISKLAAILTI